MPHDGDGDVVIDQYHMDMAKQRCSRVPGSHRVFPRLRLLALAAAAAVAVGSHGIGNVRERFCGHEHTARDRGAHAVQPQPQLVLGSTHGNGIHIWWLRHPYRESRHLEAHQLSHRYRPPPVPFRVRGVRHDVCVRRPRDPRHDSALASHQGMCGRGVGRQRTSVHLLRRQTEDGKGFLPPPTIKITGRFLRCKKDDKSSALAQPRCSRVRADATC